MKNFYMVFVDLHVPIYGNLRSGKGRLVYTARKRFDAFRSQNSVYSAFKCISH